MHLSPVVPWGWGGGGESKEGVLCKGPYESARFPPSRWRHRAIQVKKFRGLFLIYRKLKSLIIHILRVEIINHSYTEEYRHRGTVGTKEEWAQRNSGHRGTVGTEEQWAQRNSGHRGTVGTEER